MLIMSKVERLIDLCFRKIAAKSFFSEKSKQQLAANDSDDSDYDSDSSLGSGYSPLDSDDDDDSIGPYEIKYYDTDPSD